MNVLEKMTGVTHSFVRCRKTYGIKNDINIIYVKFEQTFSKFCIQDSIIHKYLGDKMKKY